MELLSQASRKKFLDNQVINCKIIRKSDGLDVKQDKPRYEATKMIQNQISAWRRRNQEAHPSHGLNSTFLHKFKFKT